jgi:hypothetical protein
MILRRFHPVLNFQGYKDRGNLFATTIFVLQSAVLKISRAMKIPTGEKLYRGLGREVELPDSFYKEDEHGCLGYLEYCFLSTTSHRETAVEYSGLGKGKPLPTVIQTSASSIDRGACIKELSQYPGEVSDRLVASQALRLVIEGSRDSRLAERLMPMVRRWSTSSRPDPTSSRTGRRSRWRARRAS